MKLKQFAALAVSVPATFAFAPMAQAGTETWLEDNINGDAVYGVESSSTVTEVEAEAKDGYTESSVGGQTSAGQTLNGGMNMNGINFQSGVNAESGGHAKSEGRKTRAFIYNESTNVQKGIFGGKGSHQYGEKSYPDPFCNNSC